MEKIVNKINTLISILLIIFGLIMFIKGIIMLFNNSNEYISNGLFGLLIIFVGLLSIRESKK